MKQWLCTLLIIALSALTPVGAQPAPITLPPATDPLVKTLLGRSPQYLQALADALTAADAATEVSISNLSLTFRRCFGGPSVRRHKLALRGRRIVSCVDERIAMKLADNPQSGLREGKWRGPLLIPNVDPRAERVALASACEARVRLKVAIEGLSPHLIVADARPPQPILEAFAAYKEHWYYDDQTLSACAPPREGLRVVGASQRLVRVMRACGARNAPLLTKADTKALLRALAALRLKAETAQANIPHAGEAAYGFKQVDLTPQGPAVVPMRNDGEIARMLNLSFSYTEGTVLNDVSTYCDAIADMRTVARVLARLGTPVTLPRDDTRAVVACAKAKKPVFKRVPPDPETFEPPFNDNVYRKR